MDEHDWLAERFEVHRGRLRAVAYRMLGSLTEAEDAVQEAWLRLSRADAGGVENLGAWLTTVVSRLCLDALRSRAARREEPLDFHVPDPIVGRADDPEQQAVLADSVGIALLVVLETLTPAERLAFVLHDMFAVPFDEIAAVVDKTPAATKMLASRARKRIQHASTITDADLNRQREVADAFLVAARGGDFEALVAVLDPDVVLRADYGRLATDARKLLRGAEAVARQAIMFSAYSASARPAVVNGGAGLITAPDGKIFSVMAFTIRNGRIAGIDILADPDRLARLDIPVPGGD
jgi:RNA polymerase sigma factor (sigma-70 family)